MAERTPPMQPDFATMMKRQSEMKLRRYQDLNKVAKKGMTVCAGSSLMENFPINELLMDMGSSKVVYNRGMSAYTIAQYDAVLDTCVLDLEPSKLFINIGSNDLNLPGDTIGNLIRGYRALLLRVKEALPDCAITLMAYYPCMKADDGFQMPGRVARTMENVNLANAEVKKLAEELGCAYIDCNAPLLDKDGYLRDDIASDPIHFYPEGYVEVLNILEPLL